MWSRGHPIEDPVAISVPRLNCRDGEAGDAGYLVSTYCAELGLYMPRDKLSY